jgi:dihydroflavonol-4-reductase
MKTIKILVTGGAGFIGSHVVKLLLQRSYQVRVLHLPSEKLDNLADVADQIELQVGDITEYQQVINAMKGCDQVIHLAAVYALWLPDQELMRRVNVMGTDNILCAAKELKLGRVVCTSSIARFGGQGRDTDGKIISATEESPFALAATKSVYAISKAEGHEVAVNAAKAGQNVVICAPTGPVGPGDISPTPTGKLILTVATLPFLATPDTVTNFGDVRDIALGHVLALEKGKTGETYLLGHQNVSALELARLTMDILDIKKPVMPVPFLLAKIGGYLALWFTQFVSRKPPLITPEAVVISELHLAADCSKAARELGMPQTDIKISLTDALIWFANNGYIKNKSLLNKISLLTSDYHCPHRNSEAEKKSAFVNISNNEDGIAKTKIERSNEEIVL